MEQITVRDFDKSKDTLENVANVWSQSFGALQTRTGITEDLSNYEVSLIVANHCSPLGKMMSDRFFL
jgi:hypothetical protein